MSLWNGLDDLELVLAPPPLGGDIPEPSLKMSDEGDGADERMARGVRHMEHLTEARTFSKVQTSQTHRLAAAAASDDDDDGGGSTSTVGETADESCDIWMIKLSTQQTPAAA